MLLASVLSTYLIMFNDKVARLLSRLAAALGRRGRDPADAGAGARAAARDVVLLGCFREGLALLDRIEAEMPALKRRVLVVDFNMELKERLEAAGFGFAYGDLAHPETLAHLGLERARMVVSTIPDSFLKGTSNRRLLLHVKKMAPEARFVATAEQAREAQELQAAGAHAVVMPAELAADKALRAMDGLL
jgi:voltage-gated potassium channel Kch